MNPKIKRFDGLALVGGHPALDFLNTVEYRGRAAPGDTLRSFESLVQWSALAGLVSRSEMAAMLASESRGRAQGARALSDAIALREAMYAVVVAAIKREPRPSQAIGLLERRLRRVRAGASLAYDTHNSTFSWQVKCARAYDVVARLADAADDLLLSLDAISVHQCRGPNCDWLFVDRSHGHRRVWCQPATCGNVVRVRRSRAGARRL
jgi:predicted RNA-binding Zn ribbon-like protein